MRRFAALLPLLLACRSAPPPAPVLSPDQLARGAATTFLACYERDGAECRAPDAPLRAWSALQSLVIVRDAIPTVILEDLPSALSYLKDEARVRRNFFQLLGHEEGWVRHAGCQPERVFPMGEAILALLRSTEERVEDLGLVDTRLGGMVAELTQSARAVMQARIVEATCPRKERSIFIALVPIPESGFRVVGIGSAFPAWLKPKATATPGTPRLHLDPASVNQVDPWLPLFEEQL